MTLQRRIIEEVSSGLSLSEVCRNDGMPGAATVIDWCAQDEAFRLRYEEAQRTSCEVWADRILEVAKTKSDHPDDVQHRRLEIDALKWLLAKRRPERYGDRTHVEHSGKLSLEQLVAESRKPAE